MEKKEICEAMDKVSEIVDNHGKELTKIIWTMLSEVKLDELNEVIDTITIRDSTVRMNCYVKKQRLARRGEEILKKLKNANYKY